MDSSLFKVLQSSIISFYPQLVPDLTSGHFFKLCPVFCFMSPSFFEHFLVSGYCIYIYFFIYPYIENEFIPKTTDFILVFSPYFQFSSLTLRSLASQVLSILTSCIQSVDTVMLSQLSLGKPFLPCCLLQPGPSASTHSLSCPSSVQEMTLDGIVQERETIFSFIFNCLYFKIYIMAFSTIIWFSLTGFSHTSPTTGLLQMPFPFP